MTRVDDPIAHIVLDNDSDSDSYAECEGSDVCPQCANSVEVVCGLCKACVRCCRCSKSNCFECDGRVSCEVCKRCENCCRCSTCAQCSQLTAELCSSCEACDDCCGCATCQECEGKVSEPCSECGFCEECCQCTSCAGCERRVSKACEVCQGCDDCCRCRRRSPPASDSDVVRPHKRRASSHHDVGPEVHRHAEFDVAPLAESRQRSSRSAGSQQDLGAMVGAAARAGGYFHAPSHPATPALHA